MPVPPLLDADLVTRHVQVRARDVVFVRGVLEASEGVGTLFALAGSVEPAPRDEAEPALVARVRTNRLVIAAPRSRAADLDRLIADLELELGGGLRREA